VKVALICEWLDVWRGGAETSTQLFINHLIDLGVQIEVYTRSHLPARPSMAVHTITVNGASRALKTLAFCRRADKAVRDSRCDVAHAITPCLAADVYQPRGGTYPETIRRNLALRPTRSARALRKLTQHLNLKQRLLSQYERRMLTASPGPVVIAISDYVARQLHEHYALPPDRIRHVYNGVEPDQTDEATRQQHRREVRRLYDIADDELLVLMVAHNFRLKGLRSWLEALARVVRDTTVPVKSLVVGRDRTAPWQRLAHRLGIEGAVQFPGDTQRSQAFYHAADILVHPTYYDPCSRVVLEAMVSGLPPVTTRFDGASEVIEDGVSGFVLDTPDDTAGLADRVTRLADAGLRGRLATAASAVADQVAMQRHAAQVLAVYETLPKGASQS